MEKEFVEFEQAISLKWLGFDESCIGYYNHAGKFEWMTIGLTNSDAKQALPIGTQTCPLYQQAFRWFRDKHGYHVEIFVDDNKSYGFMTTHFDSEGRYDGPISRNYLTYEEAELACLKKLIEIAKKKNNL